MRTVRRLRLRFLLFTTLCVVLSTQLLIALSKPSHPHQKYIATFVFATDNSVRQYTFGGGGGNRTLVQNTFYIASYSNSYIIPCIYLQGKFIFIF